jgi:hypothetical protein
MCSEDNKFKVYLELSERCMPVISALERVRQENQ